MNTNSYDPCSTFLGNGEPVKARRAAYSALSIGLIATVTTAVLTYVNYIIDQVIVAASVTFRMFGYAHDGQC